MFVWLDLGMMGGVMKLNVDRGHCLLFFFF